MMRKILEKCRKAGNPHDCIVQPEFDEREKEIIDLTLAQIKEELIKKIEEGSEDIDRTCREFLPYSVADYIPELVKALKSQIQQIIEEICK